MKKYLYLRFHIYYILAWFFFMFLPVTVFLRDILFPYNADKAMVSQLIGLMFTAVLCLLFVIGILPTLIGLKPGKDCVKNVFSREKGKGIARKFLFAGAIFFVLVLIADVIICKVDSNIFFPDFFWAPILAFVLDFIVCAAMVGIRREISKNNPFKKIK